MVPKCKTLLIAAVAVALAEVSPLAIDNEAKTPIAYTIVSVACIFR